jgi:hypothetical protein
MSQETADSRHSFAGEDEFSKRTDIFALGTLLCHLWHGHAIFLDLEEPKDQKLIQERFRTGNYPVDVENATGVDALNGECWTSRYGYMSEVLNDMESIGQ